MHLAIVCKFLGGVTGLITLGMLFPLIWSLGVKGYDMTAFVESIAVGCILSLVLYLSGVSAKAEDMRGREAFAAVTLAWIMASAIGALPFWFYEALPTYTDSYFEAMSGFSTTGATVLNEVESLPQGIILWRGVTHWLGGMGIIVLSLALFPLLGIQSSQLMNAEAPGPVQEKMTPRVQKTALILWLIYLALTFLMVLFLMIGGVNFFDALCHSFSAIATGGFSSRDASVGYFHSAYLDCVFIVFMFLSGTNFFLHFKAITGRSLRVFWRDPEFRFYTGTTAASALITAFFLHQSGIQDSVIDSLRLATFQVVSTMTTTGFTVADYEQWPAVTQVIILFAMFVGGCAGSTSGGLTQIRALVFLQHGIREFRTILSSRAVMPLKLGHTIVELPVISSCLAFVGMYTLLLLGSTFLVTLTGQDLLTSLSAALATLGNAGPGFGAIGPMRSYASQPLAVKWLYSFLMLCGRLEIFTVLILFSTAFWQGTGIRLTAHKTEPPKLPNAIKRK